MTRNTTPSSAAAIWGILRIGDPLADHSRREWDDGNDQQQKEVQEQERPVHAADKGKHRVVVYPDDADGEKADRIGSVRRPLRDEQREQLSATDGRHVELEHEQGRGDSKDAVAEGLKSTRRHRSGVAQEVTPEPPDASDSANLFKLSPTGVNISDSSSRSTAIRAQNASASRRRSSTTSHAAC